MIPMTPAQIGCLIEGISGAAQAPPYRALRLMLLRRRMAALSVVLALAGCAQGTTGQAGPPYAPYSPENNGTRPEHGGGDGGGGGGGM
jgi:hypothetical protein